MSADPDACTSVARRVVYGDGRWLELSFWVQDAANHVIEQTAADARFLNARRRWQLCMARAGFAVGEGLGAAQEYVRQHLRGDATLDAVLERTVAERDARCAQSSGLWRTATGVQAEYAHAAYAAGEAQFEEVDRLRRAAVIRAATLAPQGEAAAPMPAGAQ